MVPFIVVANLLVVLTNWVVDSSWVMTVCASVTVTLMTAGIVGLAVGLGARFPRFHVDNAAKITTGFGGVLYMMLATSYVLLMLALSVQPILVLYRLKPERGGSVAHRSFIFSCACFLLFLAPGLVVRSACGAGAHHLETKIESSLARCYPMKEPLCVDVDVDAKISRQRSSAKDTPCFLRFQKVNHQRLRQTF